jgi:peptidoglycan/xylan/chitin deacetylase (PgdA/CDA1 family)
MIELTKKLDRNLSHHIPIKPYYIKPTTAVVSFTFDDFPRSSATVASEILKKYGFTGTYYCVSDFEGTVQDGITQYTADDILNLVNDGHEIACHTDKHLDCQSLSRSALSASMKRNSEKILEMTGQLPVSFSYPFGKAGITDKIVAARQYIASRGISGGTNTGWVDFSQLKANSLYSDSTDIEETYNLIKMNSAKPGWLIFYTHDVTTNPSRYGCTPEFFENVVKKVAESGSKTLPVKHAVAYLGFRQSE